MAEIDKKQCMAYNKLKIMKKGLEKFSERLKKLRESSGAKQTDMAVLLERSERNYQRLEHGEINVPATTLMFLADYFGITTDYLLGRTDDGGPPE